MTLATLPSPNFTGADLSARVNAAMAELRAARLFASVAALLADTTMAYGSGARPVAAGDRLVTAEGHAYEVAGASASSPHLTTAGGVKLQVLPGGQGHNARAFGALGDGVADDTAAIQTAIDAGLGLHLPAGTYKITDSLRLPSSSSRQGSVYAGQGMERSILNCVGMAGKPAIKPATATNWYRVTMRDFGVQGDCDSAFDFTLTGAFQLYQSEFRNLRLVSAAGSCFKANQHFNCGWQNVHVSSVGGHGFDLGGGNTTTLIGCYAHAVPAGRYGYRIRNQATLIGCNGIDASGGEWGWFGDEPSIPDGDAHSAQRFFANLIGCNLEDWANHALRLSYTGHLRLTNCSITTKAAGSYETFIKADYAGSGWRLTEEGTAFGAKGATMSGASRIITSAGPGLLKASDVFPDYYQTSVSLLYPTSVESRTGPAYQKSAIKYPNIDFDRAWGYVLQVPSTWTANATTMSVAGRNTIKTANTAATELQVASGGELGQRLTICVTDAFTTIKHNHAASGRFLTASGANIVAASGDVFEFVHNGTNWKQV